MLAEGAEIRNAKWLLRSAAQDELFELLVPKSAGCCFVPAESAYEPRRRVQHAGQKDDFGTQRTYLYLQICEIPAERATKEPCPISSMLQRASLLAQQP